MSDREDFEAQVKAFEEQPADKDDGGKKPGETKSDKLSQEDDKGKPGDEDDDGQAPAPADNDGGDDDDDKGGAEAEADKDDEDEDEDADDGKKQDDGKKPNKIPAKQRINRLTREKYEAERRADALQQELNAYKRRPPKDDEKDDKESSPKAGDDTELQETQKRLFGDDAILKRPDPKDFEYGELDSRYSEALSDYKSQRGVAKYAATQEAKRQAEAAQKETEEFRQKLDTVRSRGGEEYDDFEEVVVQSAAEEKWPLSPVMALLISDSDVGHDVAYHLASNPSEAQRIFSLSEAGQGVEFARLEARFQGSKEDPDERDSDEPAESEQSRKEPVVSKAPEPPKSRTRGSGGTFQGRPDTKDFDSFLKQYNNAVRG